MFDDLGLTLANLADWLGIRPISLLALTLLAMGVFNVIGRLIPDTAVGWLGVTRKTCKILGIFIQNRVLPGITVSELALNAHGAARRAGAVAEIATDALGIQILPPSTPTEQPTEDTGPTEAELAGRRALSASAGINP